MNTSLKPLLCIPLQAAQRTISTNRAAIQFRGASTTDTIALTADSELIAQAKEALQKEDVAAYNKLKARLDQNEIKLDLTGFDLSHKKLPGVNLFNVDLTDGDLRNTDLTDANTTKAVLLRTKIAGVNWTGTPFDSSLPIEGLSEKELVENGLTVTSDGFILGYRSTGSKKGGWTYEVGQEYASDVFSRDKESRQHGLYFYPNAQLVYDNHKDEGIIEVKIPIGNRSASNVIKVDSDFRAPRFTVSRIVPLNEIKQA